MSQRRAAEEIGVSYKWLRRLCHHGLLRPDRRTEAELEKLAFFFGLKSADFWSTDDFTETNLRSNRTLIKWTGSKWRQAGQIVSRFPSKIATFHEPFVGGGAVLFELLRSGIEVRRFRCSDTCVPLIALWQLVQTNPAEILTKYEVHWKAHIERGSRVYYEVRESFDRTQDPCEFFFLLRTCRNGLVRFNRKGQFNSLHNFDRQGIPPLEVQELLAEWHRLLKGRDVTFSVKDYRNVRTSGGDVLYLDPPYRVPNNRIYSGEIDFEQFFVWLEGQRASYYLSLNGFVGEEDRRLAVPTKLYDQEVHLDAGIAPLSSKHSPKVTNTLYCKAHTQ